MGEENEYNNQDYLAVQEVARKMQNAKALPNESHLRGIEKPNLLSTHDVIEEHEDQLNLQKAKENNPTAFNRFQEQVRNWIHKPK